MPVIRVDLGPESYPVWVEPGLLEKLPEKLASRNYGQQWIVVTELSLAKQFGYHLKAKLKENGYRISIITIPTGERAKTLAQVESIYNQMLELNCDRSATLLALGGGVVGDVTGFVAATFMRGVDYIQIPTTLLAMVDSSIGGKTGVNLPQGKNLIGAFYQPRAVVIDPVLLRTLPKRELVSGLAEVLKYGAIRDQHFFREIGLNLKALLTFQENGILNSAIAKSCAIKAEIVSQDERESGLRRILNFGHTVGHALETITEYNTLRHGEAVAFGMLCAGALSHNRNLLDDNTWTTLRDVICQLPLPELPHLNPGEIFKIIRHDKKIKAGTLHYILLNGLGNAVISDDVSEEEILRAWKMI